MGSADMTADVRLREESLFRAAENLERAIKAPADDPNWFGNARAALRRCTLAVETRLDYLLGPQGMEVEISRNEPRLIPALDRLEASLAALLVEFWEAKGQPSSVGAKPRERLEELLAQVREVAGSEFMLVHEAFNAPGGEQ